jgi:hypothetical protein
MFLYMNKEREILKIFLFKMKKKQNFINYSKKTKFYKLFKKNKIL